MQGNRARDTGPELAVRRTLHAAGLRYRLQVAAIPGLRRTIDIAFPRQHVAIFIDGCYWHGCPEHYSSPKANAEFWREKVERNRARDADTTARLEAAGWTVLRFWTHQTPASIAAQIETVVSASQRAIAARSSSPTRSPTAV